MKRLFTMLIVLFILYLGIQFLFSWLSDGQENEYQLKTEDITFDVKELADYTTKNHSYSYNVSVEGINFDFKVIHNYGKLPKVLRDIKYFKNDKNTCILPIFKDDLILMDMLCYNNDSLTYYYNIKGQNSQLDEFVNSLTIYDQTQFIDEATSEVIEGIQVYRNNLIKDHFIGITNYRGIYNISSNFNSIVYNISLYSSDVYNQKLGIFVDSYYISANYNDEHQFNQWNIVDLVHLRDDKINSNTAISFDGYIQGVVDNKIYFYDKDSKVQYEIDISKRTVVRYSNTNIYYYKDGEWTTMSIEQANNETKFTNIVADYEDESYSRIDKVDEGYYYLYKKNGKQYDAYRIDDNKEGLIYLFSTEGIDSICYVDGYVYYVNNDKIQVYNDSFGIKTLVQYNELSFNKNLNFNVYSN